MTEQETISIAETAPEAATVQEAAKAEPPRNLFAALAKAQANFHKVVKNRINTAFGGKGFRYADIEAILSAVRPALNEQGIYLYQHVTNGKGFVNCETVLMHESGDQMSGGAITIPFSTGGKNDAQALGSAITYARRYSLSATLGISADDDDDGNACGAAPAPAPKAAPAPAPVVSAELKARAEAAANVGGEAYKALWKELSNTDRNALVKSGVHAALKAVMQENSHE